MDDPKRPVDLDDAFADLYLRARQASYSILGDLQAAEGAAADALVRAQRRWPRIRNLPHRDTWVLRAAVSAAIDTARNRTDPAPVADGHDHELVALDPAVVGTVIWLHRHQREPLVLVELCGCSTEDVAAVMEVSVASVERNVGRALDRLTGPLPGPLPAPGAGAGHAGRSVEDMRAYVDHEADRRDRRRSVAVGAGAIGVGVLVLVALIVGVLRVEPAAELSTGDGPVAPEASSNPPRAPATRSGPDTPVPPGADPTNPTTTVAGIGPTTTTRVTAPGARPPAVAAQQANPPTGLDPTTASRRSTGPVPPSGASLTPPPYSPSPTGTTGPPPTTTTTIPPTSPSDPRMCTNEDFGTTDIVWGSARSGQTYAGNTAPAGEPTWFGLSVWALDGTPCLTTDWSQALTITDAAGTVVYQSAQDDGPGRITTPGRWILFDGRIGWDPACIDTMPEPWTQPFCVPVGPGSYWAQLAIAGATPPPLAITIVGG